MPSTSVTEDSSLTGDSWTSAAFSTFSVAAPHGTCGAHTTTWVPGRVRSAKAVMPLGFPGGVTIVSVFVAKLTGDPVTALTSEALVMLLGSAEANTSAGAPWVSCVARSEDPAKLKTTVVPGWSASNLLPSSVNAFCSEAAANTVISAGACAAGDEHPGTSPTIPAAVTARPFTRPRWGFPR